MAKVNPDRAATAGAFLWRYMTARHRCVGALPPQKAAAGLARDIEDGIEVFDSNLGVDASTWPPVTSDAKHPDLFRAIVLLDDNAMPELLLLARWRRFVHCNGPIPARPEPDPDFSFRALYWGNARQPHAPVAEPA
jgi:hypothetical protein